MKNQKPEGRLEVGQIETSCKISEWEDNLSFITLSLNLGQCQCDRTNKILASRKCWYPTSDSPLLLTGVLWPWFLQCYDCTGQLSLTTSANTSHQSRSSLSRPGSSQPSLDWWGISKSDNIQRTHPTSHLTRLTIISIKVAEVLHKKFFKSPISFVDWFCMKWIMETSLATNIELRGFLQGLRMNIFCPFPPHYMVNCGAKKENYF